MDYTSEHPKMSHIHIKNNRLEDYRPTDFLIDAVHLHFDLHEEHTQVTAMLNLRRRPEAQSPAAPLVLDGESLTLQEVRLNGQALNPSDYTCDDHSLTIPNIPDHFKLETIVTIEPQKNTKLMGLYKSRDNFCTQCEAHGFRRITYFLDRPDVMAQYSTTITADRKQYPILLSNGNLIETKLLDNDRHWVHWEDPSKKPCYLFALVAGHFDQLQDTFTTQSGRSIALHLYLEPGFQDQGDFALAALKKAMRWDEQTYGREYDLDIYMIVAVSDFNMGAMENKGLNIFNTKYILAHPTTATDSDYIHIEDVIGHEYFHNWSGNRITCKNWFQITLKEGLTISRNNEFIADITSKHVMRIQQTKTLRNTQFLEDAGPLAHPIRPHEYIEVDNLYTSTVYLKGAEVIRMQRTLMTPATFRKAMDLYFSTYDGQAVTTEDFVSAMEIASGLDLTQFKRWYDQAGTPILHIDSQYDREKSILTLRVKQSCPPTPGQPKKLPFQLPLAVGFITPKGEELSLRLSTAPKSMATHILTISTETEIFTFVDVPERPIPSLLRNFSAPVKMAYDYSDEELRCLLKYDTDAFARWEAGQTLMKRLILTLIKQASDHQPLTIDPTLIQILHDLLKHTPEDLWYTSLLFTCPAESYLIQFMDNGAIDALYTALEYFKTHIGQSLQSEFEQAYRQYSSPTYQYTPTEIGKRAFKNRCLLYLAAAQAHSLALEQLKNSTNMTDQMGALLALINCDCPERQEALDLFYQQWQQQPLIVNKWLTLQAASTLPDTLDTVKNLLHHSAFNIDNPNNVYALLCTFGENVIRFHAANGEGYRFIADQVRAIDPKNSQVAARVLQPLTRWQMMDKPRQALMQGALQSIQKAPNLSKAVSEIIQKTLPKVVS